MLTAWRFEEPDRVPLEMTLHAPARGLPGADRILEFQENEADNFRGVAGFNWGFLGLDSTYREEIIEDVPGDFRRIRRTQTTSAGVFTAVTRHDYGDADPNDYHWERRYIATVDDLRCIAEARRHARPFDLAAYNQGCAAVGNRGLPSTGLFHPLGTLARTSTMEAVYVWMLTEGQLVERYLDSFRGQDLRDLVKRAIDVGAPGGGFSLRTTGGAVGNGKTREQCIKNIECNLALIDAWREFGSYR